MQTHLYLSLIPEALIFSQLSPERFGKYLAIGDKKTTRGPAMFVELDPEFRSDAFRLDEAREKCTPHPDGSSRRSTYVSVYDVLANVPVSAMGSLFLTTKDGITLELTRQPYPERKAKGLHLYQEIAPVYPQVASPLAPEPFCKYVTDPAHAVYLPRMVFCDQRLDGLATDPEKSSASNLPYPDINHLRECLTALRYKSDKMTKIVRREMNRQILYYTVGDGFYIGDQQNFAFYPMPSRDDLESTHRLWWSSAQSVTGY